MYIHREASKINKNQITMGNLETKLGEIREA